ncbi:MAG TPA: phosphatidylserine/phosphatidylglycerophosphate/cardiolipin synthase family protein [Candidatus Binatia bacterium]|jgi:phosphatidylserine/phosphatidylglycerophosphate/cardiolipin synthase-like enzyme
MRIPAATACSYPVRGGNLVRPLIDGLPAFRAILAAVDAAVSSVWVTVAFLEQDLEFPDGRGSFFDVLERAAARGLDVRVLFWSEPEIETMIADSSHFPAGEQNFRILAERAPHVLARWDRLRGYCHHQKSWLVDAGAEREVAFVGGINLDRDSLVSPRHPAGEGNRGDSVHDVYAELRGPSASDVHHNFVQRWNEASEREAPYGSFPSLQRADDLEVPAEASPERGSSIVQVARTVRSGAYRRDAAAPRAAALAIAGGETSIFEQYLTAVAAAERTIYIENQILLCPMLVPSLDAALERGVEVTVVVPGRAMPEIARARRHPKAAPLFAMIEELARHERFLMAALGSSHDDGSHEDIYVHAKVAVIDDEWATIGSANAMFRSFYDDTELNVTTWDAGVAGGLRRALFAEHLDEHDAGRAAVAACDGRYADDRAAMRLLRERALENAQGRSEGRAMRGRVFAVDPRRWAIPED